MNGKTELESGIRLPLR